MKWFFDVEERPIVPGARTGAFMWQYEAGETYHFYWDKDADES